MRMAAFVHEEQEEPHVYTWEPEPEMHWWHPKTVSVNGITRDLTDNEKANLWGGTYTKGTQLNAIWTAVTKHTGHVSHNMNAVSKSHTPPKNVRHTNIIN